MGFGSFLKKSLNPLKSSGKKKKNRVKRKTSVNSRAKATNRSNVSPPKAGRTRNARAAYRKHK